MSCGTDTYNEQLTAANSRIADLRRDLQGVTNILAAPADDTAPPDSAKRSSSGSGGEAAAASPSSTVPSGTLEELQGAVSSLLHRGRGMRGEAESLAADAARYAEESVASRAKRDAKVRAVHEELDGVAAALEAVSAAAPQEVGVVGEKEKQAPVTPRQEVAPAAEPAAPEAADAPAAASAEPESALSPAAMRVMQKHRETAAAAAAASAGAATSQERNPAVAAAESAAVVPTPDPVPTAADGGRALTSLECVLAAADSPDSELPFFADLVAFALSDDFCPSPHAASAASPASAGAQPPRPTAVGPARTPVVSDLMSAASLKMQLPPWALQRLDSQSTIVSPRPVGRSDTLTSLPLPPTSPTAPTGADTITSLPLHSEGSASMRLPPPPAAVGPARTPPVTELMSAATLKMKLPPWTLQQLEAQGISPRGSLPPTSPTAPTGADTITSLPLQSEGSASMRMAPPPAAVGPARTPVMTELPTTGTLKMKLPPWANLKLDGGISPRSPRSPLAFQHTDTVMSLTLPGAADTLTSLPLQSEGSASMRLPPPPAVEPARTPVMSDLASAGTLKMKLPPWANQMDSPEGRDSSRPSSLPLPPTSPTGLETVGSLPLGSEGSASMRLPPPPAAVGPARTPAMSDLGSAGTLKMKLPPWANLRLEQSQGTGSPRPGFDSVTPQSPRSPRTPGAADTMASLPLPLPASVGQRSAVSPMTDAAQSSFMSLPHAAASASGLSSPRLELPDARPRTNSTMADTLVSLPLQSEPGSSMKQPPAPPAVGPALTPQVNDLMSTAGTLKMKLPPWANQKLDGTAGGISPRYHGGESGGVTPSGITPRSPRSPFQPTDTVMSLTLPGAADTLTSLPLQSEGSASMRLPPPPAVEPARTPPVSELMSAASMKMKLPPWAQQRYEARMKVSPPRQGGDALSSLVPQQVQPPAGGASPVTDAAQSSFMSLPHAAASLVDSSPKARPSTDAGDRSSASMPKGAWGGGVKAESQVVSSPTTAGPEDTPDSSMASLPASNMRLPPAVSQQRIDGVSERVHAAVHASQQQQQQQSQRGDSSAAALGSDSIRSFPMHSNTITSLLAQNASPSASLDEGRGGRALRLPPSIREPTVAASGAAANNEVAAATAAAAAAASARGGGYALSAVVAAGCKTEERVAYVAGLAELAADKACRTPSPVPTERQDSEMFNNASFKLGSSLVAASSKADELETLSSWQGDAQVGATTRDMKKDLYRLTRREVSGVESIKGLLAAIGAVSMTDEGTPIINMDKPGRHGRTLSDIGEEELARKAAALKDRREAAARLEEAALRVEHERREAASREAEAAAAARAAAAAAAAVVEEAAARTAAAEAAAASRQRGRAAAAEGGGGGGGASPEGTPARKMLAQQRRQIEAAFQRLEELRTRQQDLERTQSNDTEPVRVPKQLTATGTIAGVAVGPDMAVFGLDDSLSSLHAPFVPSPQPAAAAAEAATPVLPEVAAAVPPRDASCSPATAVARALSYSTHATQTMEPSGRTDAGTATIPAAAVAAMAAAAASPGGRRSSSPAARRGRAASPRAESPAARAAMRSRSGGRAGAVVHSPVADERPPWRLVGRYLSEIMPTIFVTTTLKITKTKKTERP